MYVLLSIKLHVVTEPFSDTEIIYQLAVECEQADVSATGVNKITFCYRLFCCRQLDAQVNNGLYLIRREFDSLSDVISLVRRSTRTLN
ncbi:hypothetical protein T4B_3054 [Trichinella pseudospiralis]|uniref:Uncharacterized protein n=1 Tax=Trichinella pseudospiralis TaxID=6337 RepID=A0A0V1H4H8_TRIPS|nr:hypothetical protein T4A_13202 [Trichinella pseudospiralis]KRZ03282.1 hypothetical protein T4B_5334 [Trichinella pseudospiralis]KRZ05331.1 hypothetical protein T4B_3054 [Trichinella pseudospiralis]KRZ35389.1 hypothetical protein T4C_13165 [Trichinella pseudospiralis]